MEKSQSVEQSQSSVDRIGSVSQSQLQGVREFLPYFGRSMVDCGAQLIKDFPSNIYRVIMKS